MPGSVRALRRTYGRLHAEGHIDNKAAILVRAGEKRSIDDNEIDRSRKRVRFVRSHLRNQPLAIKSTSLLDSTVIEHSNNTNGDAIAATDELQLQNANR
jgi:hypothetical protein